MVLNLLMTDGSTCLNGGQGLWLMTQGLIERALNYVWRGKGIQPSLLRWAREWHANLKGEMNLLKCIYSNAALKGRRSGPLAIFSLWLSSFSLFLLSFSLVFFVCPALGYPHSRTNTGSQELMIFGFLSCFAWSKRSCQLLPFTPNQTLLWDCRACVMVHCGL